MAVFVLVHGGFQGGWSFKALARQLRQKGHEVYIATLTGLGERCHLIGLPINLDTHLDDVANMIVWEDLTEVVLVGHSYGGMIITGVADRFPGRVSMLVYLDAAVPNDGDTLLSLRPEYQQYFLDSVATTDGRSIKPPLASARDAAAKHWQLLNEKNVAHPITCFTQAIRLTGAHSSVRRRLYIYAKGNLFDGAYERFRGETGSEVICVADAGHSIMLDQPEVVCSILLAAIDGVTEAEPG